MKKNDIKKRNLKKGQKIKKKLRKKSIKADLVRTYSVVLLIIFMCISSITYFTTANQLKNLKETMLKTNVEKGSKLASEYIKNYYGKLYFDGKNIVDDKGNNLEKNNLLVDALKSTQGIDGTIFIKEGEEFKAITTSETDGDNSRQTGYYMDKDSAAYKGLTTDLEYAGKYESFGKEFEATIRVIADNKGNVGGAFLLAIPIDDVNTLLESYSKQNIIYSIVTSGVALAVCVFFTIILAIRITRPIERLTRYSKKVADLDVSEDVPELLLKRNDEIGELSNSFQKVSNGIRNFLKEVYDNTKEISYDAVLVKESSEEISIVSDGVVVTVNNISKTSIDQATDTQKGASCMEELNIVMENGLDTTNKLTVTAEKVKDLKNDGIILVDELTYKANDNLKGVEAVKEIISETKDRSIKIKKAAEMIKNIARQTDLLAMNARIEASHAGQYGKSFAVVANEIKSLAENSNDFSEEIEKIIEELIVKVKDSVDTISTLEVAMFEQNESVKNTKLKFEGIALSIEEIENIVEVLNSINKSIKEKREEVNVIIQNLTAISEENAASTEEVSASIEEQNASLLKISTLGVALEKVVSSLEDKLSEFKY